MKPMPALAGYVKIGKKTEKGYPTSLDHFIIKPIIPHWNELLTNSVGDKPNSLNVKFLSDDWIKISNSLKSNNGRIVAWGDGDEYYRSTPNGVVKENPSKWGDKYFESLAKKYNTKWGKVLMMDFMIEGCPIYGRWRLKSYGETIIIPEIEAAINAAKEANDGTIVGLNFLITVNKRESAMAEGKKIFPVLSIFPILKTYEK